MTMFAGGLGGAGRLLPRSAAEVRLEQGLMPAFCPAEELALCSESSQPGLRLAMKMQVSASCPVPLLLIVASMLAFLYRALSCTRTTPMSSVTLFSPRRC